MKNLALVSLIAGLVLLLLFPFFFGELLATSLSKLHLGREQAFLIALAILFGGLVNIPIRQISGGPAAASSAPLSGFPPRAGAQDQTLIAVNVGGCLIPAALAIYEIAYISVHDFQALAVVGASILINTAVCYVLARPIEGLGIAIPGFAPALVAVLCALLFAPENAPPVAFITGVSGPLIGADLLHLKDIAKAGPAVASIGGAGTFDGIVLSGILATYLA